MGGLQLCAAGVFDGLRSGRHSGMVMLHESVSPLRWLGIAVICLGVVVVGRTHPNTTEDDLTVLRFV